MSQPPGQQGDGGKPTVLGKFAPVQAQAVGTVPAQAAGTTGTSGLAGRVRGASGARPQAALTAGTPAVSEFFTPLLGDAAGLRANWQRVQEGFVDDPQAAVGDAADLVEHAAQALIGALRLRQRQLRTMWDRGSANAAPTRVSDSGQPGSAAASGVPDTEELRQMMQRYRALFNQICRP